LMSAERPGQVIGVLAHEIGHITGGHLARLEGALDDARSQALIGQIIGLALGVLAKDGGVAAAGSAAGTDVAVKNLLKFSRIQEQSADQVAVNLLDQTQTSARGLLEFFELLQDQELLVRARQDDYVVTHPLTQNRIEFVRNHVAKSPYSDKKLPTILQAMHDRMVAKLKGFINPPSQTLFEFKAEDPSVMARYARTVAYYRNARIAQALPIIDGLINDAPDDAYFHELKGQILFENGRIKEALPSYQKAVDLQPNQPLLRVGLAHAQIELNRPDMVPVALRNLQQAIRYDRKMPLSWRLAATAYGRNGDLGMSALALAEHNLLLGRNLDAAGQAKKAQRLLKENSPSWLRAQDITNTADRARQKQNNR
jgi:predicted Zn-dependent protease